MYSVHIVQCTVWVVHWLYTVHCTLTLYCTAVLVITQYTVDRALLDTILFITHYLTMPDLSIKSNSFGLWLCLLPFGCMKINEGIYLEILGQESSPLVVKYKWPQLAILGYISKLLDLYPKLGIIDPIKDLFF